MTPSFGYHLVPSGYLVVATSGNRASAACDALGYGRRRDDQGHHLRRLALTGSGLTFGVIGLAAIVAPHQVAAQYGLRPEGLDGLDGLAEVRDLCGLMILLQALGRVLGLVVDGRPSAPFLGAMAAELVTAILILAPRFLPDREADGGSRPSP